jgi:hypothetical protein
LNTIGTTQKSHNFSKVRPLSIVAVITISLLAFWCNIGNAAQVTLAWDAATDTGLAGYKIYYGTQTKQYSYYIDAGNLTAIIVPDLTAGQTYYFAATAYNSDGTESDYSNEVIYSLTSTCSYSISPSSQTFASSGGSISITVTTQSGCSWTANSNAWMTATTGSSGTGNGTVTYSVSANSTTSTRYTSLTIANQTFTASQNGSTAYTITASSGTGGSITPAGTSTVSSGSSQSYTITPASGYSISSVSVDGASKGAVSSYTFSNVTANHTISATFQAMTYSLTKSTSGTGVGTITSSPAGTSFASGTLINLTATAANGSTFSGWSGACTGTSTTCQITMNSNKSVSASFTLNQNTTAYYTITSSAGIGGTITPSGMKSIKSGSSQSYSIKANTGYKIKYIQVDGRLLSARSTYSFSNIKADHTITAIFGK